MKISRMKMVIALCATTLLLGGCGDAPYELTDSEESLIVNYAAHVVAKYNTKQKDGMTYVSPSKLAAEEDTEADTEIDETVEDTEMPDNTTDSSAGADSESVGQEEVTGKSLQDVFGTDSLAISYNGYEVNPNYIEEDYYSLNATSGNTYVIMNIGITNNGTEDVTLDNLTKTPSFRADIDGTEVVAQTTILLSDFSTYQGTITPGQTVNTVLIFEVSEDVAANITEIGLTVNVNGEKVTIIL